ncbi:MAG: hypothetical protein HQL07_14710 [Nitrospirae bacterium]|nr:hypothetical protein [Magnetococcales bacterium]HAT49751.1 hypothetical protein [Alphaproteobacteria bacterium]
MAKIKPLMPEEAVIITKAALSDPDNPPLTDEQLASMRPMAEVLPNLAKPGKQSVLVQREW